MFKRKAKVLVENTSAFDNALISWEAPEFLPHERGRIWKAFAVTVVLVAAVLGVIFNAWTFSLAVVAFAVAYYIVLLEHPNRIEVKISDIGIKVGPRKYAYGQIKAFWIIYNPPHTKTLNIRVAGDFLGDITIQLDGQDPAVVREFLLKRIPELEGKKEPTMDVILKLFKL